MSFYLFLHKRQTVSMVSMVFPVTKSSLHLAVRYDSRNDDDDAPHLFMAARSSSGRPLILDPGTNPSGQVALMFGLMSQQLRAT